MRKKVGALTAKHKTGLVSLLWSTDIASKNPDLKKLCIRQKTKRNVFCTQKTAFPLSSFTSPVVVFDQCATIREKCTNEIKTKSNTQLSPYHNDDLVSVSLLLLLMHTTTTNFLAVLPVFYIKM